VKYETDELKVLASDMLKSMRDKIKSSSCTAADIANAMKLLMEHGIMAEASDVSGFMEEVEEHTDAIDDLPDPHPANYN